MYKEKRFLYAGVPYWAPTIVLLKKENKHDKTNETNHRQPA